MVWPKSTRHTYVCKFKSANKCYMNFWTSDISPKIVKPKKLYDYELCAVTGVTGQIVHHT